MSGAAALIALAALVSALTALARLPSLEKIFRWLPLPLWCYLVPMLLTTVGFLSQNGPYKPAADGLLPMALIVLLMSVDLRSILQTGGSALASTAVGAAAVMAGTIIGVFLFRHWLPEQAWKGAGALAATWTGGTMNLLAMRTLLEPPEAVFAPLILVDALVAYTWMAVLVAASTHQAALDRWLKADESRLKAAVAPALSGPLGAPAAAATRSIGNLAATLGFAALLTFLCQAAAVRLPRTLLTASPTAWTVLLATTAALLVGMLPAAKRASGGAQGIGSFFLLIVLALAGAQAKLGALGAAASWLGVGATVVAVHAVSLLVFGRLRRIPLAVLATASQANIGGMVSAPIVGALYHPSLAALGLLLAVGCNALGTYAGLVTAACCRWISG